MDRIEDEGTRGQYEATTLDLRTICQWLVRLVPESNLPIVFHVLKEKAVIQIHEASGDEDPATPLELRLLPLFHTAKNEIFESGFETSFDQSVAQAITSGGKEALEALKALIERKQIPQVPACKALEVIGAMMDSRTEAARMAFLKELLRHEEPLIRYGATIGLSYMNAREALDCLVEAVSRENDTWVRESMSSLIASIQG
ncbi:MAG TPA: HEAT repeat domain-containing protein [Candidatus Obscuribacterales bacterium]